MDAKNIALFENNRSSWDLVVTAPELRRVFQAFAALVDREFEGTVWVQKIGPATRRWFAEGFKARAFIDTAGSDSDPIDPIALPVVFLATVGELSDAYGTATIFMNEDEEVLTAKAGGEYVFVDEFVDVNSPAPFDPLEYEIKSADRRYEKVSVRSDVVDRMVNGYRNVFHSIEKMGGPPAFISLSTTRDEFRWTTDWSRWDRPRVSGYSTASTWINHFEVKFYPVTVFNFLNGLFYEDELVLGCDDSVNAAMFSIAGLDWAVWCPVQDENIERWGERLTAAFKNFGFQEAHANPDDEDDVIDLMFLGESCARYDRDDVSITVQVIEGVSGFDCIRLSNAVMHNCFVTEQLLREVMNINSELVNARITVDDNSLDLIVDIDNPTEVSDIAKGIHCMLVAIGRCAGLDEFLPLFGGIKPNEWDEEMPGPDDVPND
mgnify:FL=1